MLSPNRIKQISVIASYTWILVAIYFFSWKPTSIFIGFVMEMVVLLLLYVVFRIKAQQDSPRAFRKVGDLGPILFGVSIFVFVSYKMIEGFTWRLDPDGNSSNFLELISSKELIVSFLGMLVIYLFQTVKLQNDLLRELVLRQNLMIKILAMSLTTLIPFLLIFEFETLNFLFILPFVFLARVIVELLLKDSTET